MKLAIDRSSEGFSSLCASHDFGYSLMKICIVFLIQVLRGQIENTRKNCDDIYSEFKSKNCTKSFGNYELFPLQKWRQEFNITGEKVLWEEAMLTDCPVVQFGINYSFPPDIHWVRF